MGLLNFMILSQMPSRKSRPELRALDFLNWRSQARAKNRAEEAEESAHEAEQAARSMMAAGMASEEPKPKSGLLDTFRWNYASNEKQPRARQAKPAMGWKTLAKWTAVDPDGQELGMRDRYRLGKELGRYAMQSFNDKIASLARKLQGDPDKRGRRLSNKFFKDMKDMDDGVNRSEINGDPEHTAGNQNQDQAQTEAEADIGIDIDQPTIERMDDGASREMDAFREDVRVYVTPDSPENRVSSNHVGPERQVTQNNDPWPLDKPSQKEAGSGIKLIGSDEPKSDLKPARPAQIKGPEPRPALESPQAQKKRSGKAAADRGASRARQIAETKPSGPKSKTRKDAEQEM